MMFVERHDSGSWDRGDERIDRRADERRITAGYDVDKQPLLLGPGMKRDVRLTDDSDGGDPLRLEVMHHGLQQRETSCLDGGPQRHPHVVGIVEPCRSGSFDHDERDRQSHVGILSNSGTDAEGAAGAPAAGNASVVPSAKAYAAALATSADPDPWRT
jgi:hypothetical protein